MRNVDELLEEMRASEGPIITEDIEEYSFYVGKFFREVMFRMAEQGIADKQIQFEQGEFLAFTTPNKTVAQIKNYTNNKIMPYLKNVSIEDSDISNLMAIVFSYKNDEEKISSNMVSLGWATDEGKTTSAQRKASRNWEKKNPERNKYLASRRQARSFFNNYATEEDLTEFKNIIDEKLKSVENPTL